MEPLLGNVKFNDFPVDMPIMFAIIKNNAMHDS